MELELLRVAVAVAGCAAAACYDVFNKRNVPNNLTYVFVAMGVLLNFWQFDLTVFAGTAAVALVVGVLSYLFYRTGQIGGADVLMFVGLAFLLPETRAGLLQGGQAQALFTLPFIVSLFVSSGFLFMLGITLQFVPKAVRAVLQKKSGVKPANAAYAAIVLVAYAALAYVANGMGFSPSYFAIVGVLVFCSAFIVTFRELIVNSMIENVGLKEIEEEDVLAIEKMDAKVVKKYRLQKLITLEQLKRLKETRLKKFPVFKHMPAFLPFLLGGLILSLLIGDVLAFLTQLALS
ncbi:prepilin peptidase [Candidatus Micrarchaeota archaeon]|nr:prepilin peptidase [Candidatus Micrarchaeota archaeon]